MAPEFLISAPRCIESHEAPVDCSFQVAWEINPHMKCGSVSFHEAEREHRAFRETCLALGASVVDVPFVHGAYDSVFVKDSAVLTARDGVRRALLASLVHPERRREQRARQAALESLGFKVAAAPGASLEGGDVVMLPNGNALLGYGQRSARAAAAPLERFLEARVTPLELKDPWLYHLDTAVAVLRDGTALVAKGALTPASRRALESTEGISLVVDVPRREALGFALNVVQIGNSVIVGRDSVFLRRVLRALGLRCVLSPLHQFQSAGGSAACLVAEVHFRDMAEATLSNIA